MKIKPEIFLLQKNEINYNQILITGSDESFINYLTLCIVGQFKKNNYLIDKSGSVNKELTGDLFSEKKVLFLLKDITPKTNMETGDGLNHVVLISCINNKKINNLKLQLSKSKTSLVLDCYPLNRSGKELVVRNFLEENNIKLKDGVFWYAVENLENEYVLLKNQLTNILLFKKEIKSIDDVESFVFVKNKIEINKIFFHILKNNETLVNIYNKNIYSISDFYIFLNNLKLYLKIISESLTREEALSKLPKYLFNEKEKFLNIYKLLNKQKILKIYKNIFKVEGLIRKNSELYFEIGLRFFINTKKIITS